MKPEALGGAAQGPWNASKLLRAKLNGKLPSILYSSAASAHSWISAGVKNCILSLVNIRPVLMVA